MRVAAIAPPKVSLPETPVRASAGTPEMPGAMVFGDLQSLMSKMQIARRTVQSEAATANASSARAEREQKLAEARDALREAQEAQRDAEEKGGIISTLETVATVAAAVAAVASVVVTGGASTPAIIALAGVALSASSSKVAEATDSQELGIACAVGGALMSGGAGLASSGAAATEVADATARAGRATISVTAETLKTAARVAATSAKLLEGTARMGQGVMIIKQHQDQGRAEDRTADSKLARAEGVESQQKEDDAIEVLRRIEASNQRAVGIIMSTAKTVDASRDAVISNIGRRV